MTDRPFQVGDRVVVTLHRAGSPPEPFDAAGILISLEPPHRPVLGYVRLDDHTLGEPAVGLSRLRREPPLREGDG